VRIAYGREFQRRHVPHVENVQITSLSQSGEHFQLTTAAGETMHARRVVVAAGIVKFAYLPPTLASIPGPMISHSSQHSDLSGFKGRKVAVLGAGASALDTAALLLEAGAEVELVARRRSIQFHDPPNEPRTLLQRLKAPRSGLGTGWRSRMCTDIPLVFHAMPQSLRIRAVARHLGPAPCWFVRDAAACRCISGYPSPAPSPGADGPASCSINPTAKTGSSKSIMSSRPPATRLPCRVSLVHR
jgi:cation diffusion facilitator CzcD-associated flavoprotein CzcO